MSALDILSFDSGAKRLNDWFQEVHAVHAISFSVFWRLILLSLNQF